MTASYLLILLVSIAGLAVLDCRYRLLFWRNTAAAARAILIGLVGLFAWDLSGIALGIFFPGKSAYTLGILVVPGLPVEELLFLTLFCYLTLLLWQRRVA